MNKPASRHLSCVAAIAVATTAGAHTGNMLAAHDVPLWLLLACVMAVASTTANLLLAVVAKLSTASYRCPATGCTFRVQLHHSDPIDIRRWQEAAAAHPAHRLPRT